MTFTEEYNPTNTALNYDEPNYPKAFGLTLTPNVAAIALGLAGLVGGLYLWTSLIAPVQEANRLLEEDIVAKEQEVATLDARSKQIGKVQAELKAAEAKKGRVMRLFAQEKSLDTLMLDVSRLAPKPRPKSEKDKDLPPQLTLKEFSPSSGIETLQDGSLGELVNGKLNRQTYTVQLEGGYADTQKFIGELERFQPLLQVTELASTAEAPVTKVTAGPRGLSIRADQNPKLTTGFKLNVLMSRSPEEIAAQAAAAAPAPAQPAQ